MICIISEEVPLAILLCILCGAIVNEGYTCSFPHIMFIFQQSWQQLKM